MLKLQYHDSAAVKREQPISLATGYNELRLRKENGPLLFQDFIFRFGYDCAVGSYLAAGRPQWGPSMKVV